MIFENISFSYYVEKLSYKKNVSYYIIPFKDMIKENYESTAVSGDSDHISIDETEALLKYYSDVEINGNSYLSKSYSLKKILKKKNKCFF